MPSETDRAQVRLAELVAALSLGIDLGFGQPMEHVLRQCLIALRLAERIGLDEAERAVVYYTALLRQRRLPLRRARAGEVVRRRHRAEVRQVRPRAAQRASGGGGHAAAGLRATRRCIASGSGSSSRSPGHRDVDDMIAHHAAIARGPSASSSGCPDAVLDALGAAYEQWDGRGWPGELEGEDVPLAVAARAARRVRRGRPSRRRDRRGARALARKRSGKQFDPALAELMGADADMILAGLDSVATWDAVIDAEPALAVVLSGERFDAALLAIANFVDLKSPYFARHARAVADLAADAAAQLRASPERGAGRCAAPGSCTTSAGSASRTRSGTSAARSAPASGSACACTRT